MAYSIIQILRFGRYTLIYTLIKELKQGEKNKITIEKIGNDKVFSFFISEMYSFCETGCTALTLHELCEGKEYAVGGIDAYLVMEGYGFVVMGEV
jgi:hypothetical protein